MRLHLKIELKTQIDLTAAELKQMLKNLTLGKSVSKNLRSWR